VSHAAFDATAQSGNGRWAMRAIDVPCALADGADVARCGTEPTMLHCGLECSQEDIDPLPQPSRSS
jgi:hypothetical protein